MAIRIAGGDGRWEWVQALVPCLPCPPPPPHRTLSTLSTLCTTAPFPVVPWQYTAFVLCCALWSEACVCGVGGGGLFPSSLTLPHCWIRRHQSVWGLGPGGRGLWRFLLYVNSVTG